MKDVIKKYFVWIFLFVTSISEVNGQNLALGKNVNFSSKPNYALTASTTDLIELTDGVFTKGRLWSSKGTVGWQRLNRLTVTIDLIKPDLVGEIFFSTARGIKSNVYFPSNIYVFTSNDKKKFDFLGDAAQDNINKEGEYATKKFGINANRIARYISFVVIPKGKFIFCDEIEIFKGASNSVRNGVKKVTYNLEKFVDSLGKHNYLINELRSQPSERDPLIKGNKAERKDLSIAELEDIKGKRDQLHANKLKARFLKNIILEKANPWEDISSNRMPSYNLNFLDYNFSIPFSGVTYGAFIITNAGKENVDFALSQSGNADANVKFYNAVYVPSKDFKQIIDPIVPLNNKLILNPGVAQMIIFKIYGNNVGVRKNFYSIKIGSSLKKLNITYNTLSIPKLDNKNQINTINWAYLNSNILRDSKSQAAQDLKTHKINTIVIPQQYIPKLNNADFTQFKEYLTYFKYAKNIMLFSNYSLEANKSATKDMPFLSVKWKESFKLWYLKMVSAVKEQGFSEKQIYFYPYDEVKGNDIAVFQELIKWLKTEIPTVQIYATINNEEAKNQILPLVDIAQVSEKIFSSVNFSKNTGKIWIYKGAAPSRSLSPYKYYRLFSWEAFIDQVQGIGFWNYADVGRSKNKNLIIDEFIDNSNDYSVIYNGPNNSIFSSRRWEAFSLGVEDHQVLSLYEKKFGRKKAVDIAKQVINNASNLNLADEIKVKMLREILLKK